MPSEFIQRQIDRLLEQAAEALSQLNWDEVRDRAQAVLRLDPDNADARTLMEAAGADTNPEITPTLGGPEEAGRGDSRIAPTAQPTSFANGRYVVKKFLGEGGKKKVYLSDDTLLDRDVAFASIKTEGLDEVGRQRIRREAQAMARLGSHPHIVAVLDLGEENGQPYIVTELMTGGDVEALIEKAPDHKLSLERALEIAVQVCKGLEHAHFHEIVHRDVKPGNVWLTADGVAKIGDFGLAVLMDKIRLTQVGMMVGTVSYMPPEQAMGGERDPDKRSDLYSLGAMLYEMVCGRPPFIGDDSIGIIGQHINTPPVSPSWHRPDLPQSLETLILRLLEKDLTKRPATAAEVRQALEAIDVSAHGEPVEPSDGPSTSSGRTDGVTDSPLYRRSFVGREAELRQLKTAFDNSLSGSGSMMMLVGEPGIGKTALCEQIATYVTLRGGRTLVGHCYEEGSLSLPYLGFVEAIRTYVLARPPEALKDELGTGATDVARIVSEVRERVTVEVRPSGDPEEDRWRLLQSVTGFLRNAAVVQPLLIVLEDLHWADRGTLDLLIHLARNLAGTRLLVVGTYRDIEVDRAHPLSAALAELRRAGEYSRVLLHGLSIDEVHRMIKIIGGQESSWGFAEAVHRQTEGNPLFIQEVLRYVVEEGLVTRQGGRWHSTGDTPLEMSIPEGLRDVIGRRLSRLSPECNRLLSIAAVIGRDFALQTLQAVAVGAPTPSGPLQERAAAEEAIVVAIEDALKVGVLEEQSRVGVIRYRFAHAFFRQTLYEEMSAPRRLRLHQQVARALEAQYGARLEEHAAEMAEHFAQSTDPADLVKAIYYSELAAGRASAVYAYSEAGRLLEQAIEVQEVLDPDDKAKRCDLLLDLSEALLPAGEPLRVAEEIAEKALELAEALDDRARASRACRLALQGALRYGSGAMFTTPIYRRWVERADRYADPGTSERVYADSALAMFMINQPGFHYSEVTALVRGSLELAQKLDDPEALFHIAERFILIASAPQNIEEILRLADDVTRRPRERVSVRVQTLLLYWSALLYLNWGDRARAEELWRQIEDLAARTRDADLIIRSLGMEATFATVDGRLEEAMILGERMVARGEELGNSLSALTFANTATSTARLHLGRGKEALNNLREATRRAGGEPGTNLAILAALDLAHAGRLDEANSALGEVMSRVHISEEAEHVPFRTLTALLEIAVLVKNREAADILADKLAVIPSLLSFGHGSIFHNTSVARHLGAAAALLGDREKAKAYYQQALEACAKIRFRPEIALTRLQLAEMLLEEAEIRRSQGQGDLAPTDVALDVGERGQPSSPSTGEDTGGGDASSNSIRKEAMGHLDFAIVEFQEMKMQPSLERALRHKGLLKA